MRRGRKSSLSIRVNWNVAVGMMLIAFWKYYLYLHLVRCHHWIRFRSSQMHITRFFKFRSQRKWSKMIEKMKKRTFSSWSIGWKTPFVWPYHFFFHCGCRNFVIYFTWKLWFMWQTPAKRITMKHLNFSDFSTEFGGWGNTCLGLYLRLHNIIGDTEYPLNNRIRVTNKFVNNDRNWIWQEHEQIWLSLKQMHRKHVEQRYECFKAHTQFPFYSHSHERLIWLRQREMRGKRVEYMFHHVIVVVYDEFRLSSKSIWLTLIEWWNVDSFSRAVRTVFFSVFRYSNKSSE